MCQLIQFTYEGKITGTKAYRFKREQPLIHVCALFSFTASDSMKRGFMYKNLENVKLCLTSGLHADTSHM